MRRTRAPRPRPLAAALCACLSALACAPRPVSRRGATKAQASPDEAHKPLAPREGNYHCYFSRRGVDEPRAPCRIARAAGGALRLEGGGPTTRIDGAIRPLDHHSFGFEGSLFAAPGGEKTPTSGALERIDVHVYSGRLAAPGGPVWVTVAYIPSEGQGGVTIPLKQSR